VRRILAALLAAAAFGCAGAPPPSAAIAAGPLAYAVDAPGGGHALLFGSIHVARENQWSLPEHLMKELAQSELLVLEIDLAETGPDEMADLMFGLGTMPPGQRLRQVVSDETWDLLKERATQAGLEIEVLDGLKPWLVFLQLTVLSLEHAGFAAERGAEPVVVQHAPNLPVRGLETVYEQLSAFDDLSYPVQDRMLLDALRPTDEQAVEFDALMEAWRRGDARQLEAIVFKDRNDPGLATFYEETFYRRNLRMAETLEEILLESERSFVVVGAAHLVGEGSIPHLLRAAGYEVRQVSGTP
jgi:uncharacterized protein YbaP (TraB family)